MEEKKEKPRRIGKGDDVLEESVRGKERGNLCKSDCKNSGRNSVPLISRLTVAADSNESSFTYAFVLITLLSSLCLSRSKSGLAVLLFFSNFH